MGPSPQELSSIRAGALTPLLETIRVDLFAADVARDAGLEVVPVVRLHSRDNGLENFEVSWRTS